VLNQSQGIAEIRKRYQAGVNRHYELSITSVSYHEVVHVSKSYTSVQHMVVISFTIARNVDITI